MWWSNINLRSAFRCHIFVTGRWKSLSRDLQASENSLQFWLGEKITWKLFASWWKRHSSPKCNTDPFFFCLKSHWDFLTTDFHHVPKRPNPNDPFPMSPNSKTWPKDWSTHRWKNISSNPWSSHDKIHPSGACGAPPIEWSHLRFLQQAMQPGAQAMQLVIWMIWMTPKHPKTASAIAGWYTYPSENYWKIGKSVQIMKFPIYGQIKMLQTTNQKSYIPDSTDLDLDVESTELEGYSNMQWLHHPIIWVNHDNSLSWISRPEKGMIPSQKPSSSIIYGEVVGWGRDQIYPKSSESCVFLAALGGHEQAKTPNKPNASTCCASTTPTWCQVLGGH